MSSLFKTLVRREKQRDMPLSLSQWVEQINLTYGGNSYTWPSSNTYTLGARQEEIGGDFRGYVDGVYKNNGVVFACMLVRQLLFSEARFQWRRLRSGRPGDYFGTAELQILERPWPNATTGDLLTRAIQDVDLSGNFYCTRLPNGVLQRLRPDWVTILIGDPGELTQQLAGYLYHPDGPYSDIAPVALFPEQVCHFAPVPDPSASYRGMSWLTPVIREIMGDNAANDHKLKYFENGATPNMVVSLSPDIQPDRFNEWVELFQTENEGLQNAYKTMFLGGGASTTVVGSDMRQVDFKLTQGTGETRIAAAAGVPPVIVGLSEGLDSATYSNYAQARRRLADGTMRPLWRNFAGSMAQIMNVPGGSELWYDDRDIPFLQEDQIDAAQVQTQRASTINTLITAGFKPDVVVQAVMADDLGRLANGHTGMYSVQLQPPGAGDTPSVPNALTSPAKASNGNGNAPRDLLGEFRHLLNSS